MVLMVEIYMNVNYFGTQIQQTGSKLIVAVNREGLQNYTILDIRVHAMLSRIFPVRNEHCSVNHFVLWAIALCMKNTVTTRHRACSFLALVLKDRSPYRSQSLTCSNIEIETFHHMFQ